MAAPFDITLTDAGQKTLNFQVAYANNIKALSFPKNEILEILGQANCTGIRIYFALNDPARPKDLTVVICGVKDVVSGASTDVVDIVSAGSKIKNSGTQCPPNCTTPSNDLSH
jgi:NADPH-dependent curcumin reductase CurA